MVIVTGETWQWVMLGVDTAVLYLLRRWYRDKVLCAEEIQNTKTYEISESLRETLREQEDGTLPYACIEGSTHALGKTLTSQFNQSETGVIQQIKFVEHKSKRTNGYWSDVKKIIKDQTQVSPFAIAGNHGNSSANGSPVLVEVAEPLSADFLLDDLTTIHDNYTPNSDTLLSRGIDRLFGEVSKGYQETEKMLSVGVKILGVGKIVLDGGKMVLEPPSDENKRFILSTMSKKNVIKDLKSDARMIKWFMVLFGVCGTGLLGYLLYRNIRHWVEQYKVNMMYREIQQQRALRQRDQTQRPAVDDADSDEEKDLSQICIICLTNPREVVILECGHVCVCADCARILPDPKKCPVCRGHVSRYIPLYRS